MYSNLAGDAVLDRQSAPLAIPRSDAAPSEKFWYAVYTYPQHEKSCTRQLAQRGVITFLPTYTKERLWKNRQRVKIELPLFPSYLFVHVDNRERFKVASAPGVLRLLGSAKGPQPIPSEAIELLRSDIFKDRMEPHPDIAVGQKVRIRSGAMQGVEGVLVRKKNGLWFVLSIELINQRASVEVQAQDIESIQA